jgi:hypothetical protein
MGPNVACRKVVSVMPSEQTDTRLSLYRWACVIDDISYGACLVLQLSASTMLLVSNTYALTKLRGRSPQANYTDRGTAACRRS